MLILAMKSGMSAMRSCGQRISGRVFRQSHAGATVSSGSSSGKIRQSDPERAAKPSRSAEAGAALPKGLEGALQGPTENLLRNCWLFALERPCLLCVGAPLPQNDNSPGGERCLACARRRSRLLRPSIGIIIGSVAHAATRGKNGWTLGRRTCAPTNPPLGIAAH